MHGNLIVVFGDFERCYRAVQSKDARFDGWFVTAVLSTGIYCRPSCANGRNPIAIIVPCHRVIGSSGSLTGYGGGLDRKRRLLDLEAGTRALAVLS